MGDRKSQIQSASAKATQSTKLTACPPSSSSSCLGNSNIVPGKVCVLGSMDGSFGEEISLITLRAQYGSNAELINFEENSDLSSCDKVVINAHSNAKIIGFPGHLSDGLTPEALSNYLQDHGFQGSEITLAACNTGTSIDTDKDGVGDYTFGKDLANHTGKPVKGYPHDTTIRFGSGDNAIKEDHRIYHSDGSSESEGTSKGRPIIFEPDPLYEIEKKLGIK